MAAGEYGGYGSRVRAVTVPFGSILRSVSAAVIPAGPVPMTTDRVMADPPVTVARCTSGTRSKLRDPTASASAVSSRRSSTAGSASRTASLVGQVVHRGERVAAAFDHVAHGPLQVLVAADPVDDQVDHADPHAPGQSGRVHTHLHGVGRGVDDHQGLVEASGQGPAEVLHPGMGVQEHDLIPAWDRMSPRAAARSAVSGQKQPPPARRTAAHHQEPDPVGSFHAQTVHDVGGVGVQTQHPPTPGAGPAPRSSPRRSRPPR